MSTKNSALYALAVVVGSVGLTALPGCNSSERSSDSPEQRTKRQAAGRQTLVPQAQGLAAQQTQQKNQMDSMRAKDAAKAPH